MDPQSPEQLDSNQRRQEILLAQVRLLCANANSGVCVAIVAAAILGYLQWDFVSHSAVVAWWIYMALATAARYAVARYFRDASPPPTEPRGGRALFGVR